MLRNMGYLRTIISLLVFAAITMAVAGSAWADYGATIEAANCNPAADPALDSLQTDTVTIGSTVYYPLRSCISQNINVGGLNNSNPFYIQVRFEPNQIYYCLTTGCIPDTITTDSVWIKVGDTASVSKYKSSGDPATKATIYPTGDKACITMHNWPIPYLQFKPSRSSTYNTNYGSDEVDPASVPVDDAGEPIDDGALARNCVFMPEPPKASLLTVPAFVSKTCSDYETSGSQFFWPKKDASGSYVRGKSRSFIGVVVQCIEDTMTNLFFNTRGPVGSEQSVFTKMQANLQSYIAAMLTLYIIAIGIRYGIIQRGASRNEFIWMILKPAIVMYFASSLGMSALLPSIVNTMKYMSGVVISAASGAQVDKNAVKATRDQAQIDYDNALASYSQARKLWGACSNSTDPTTVTTCQDAQQINVDNARQALNNASSDLQNAKAKMLSFGYDYCDFTPFVSGNQYMIPTTYAEDTTLPYPTVIDGVLQQPGYVIPAGAKVQRDMGYMYLWDTLDCRISKYFGIGANPHARTTPQFILLATGMLLIGPIGWIIFALSLVFLVFVTLVILRVVHVYIISYIAIILLAYISPFIIPMSLFTVTKGSFDKWLRLVIAYFIQPIMLFTFLAFMFAVLDGMIWGSNYDFYPVDKTQLYQKPQLTDNTIQRINKYTKAVCNPTTGVYLPECVCPDRNSIGCLFERFQVEKKSIKVNGQTIFSAYVTTDAPPATSTTNLGTLDGTPLGASLETHNGNASTGGLLSFKDSITYMFGMMKIVFACFIFHALLAQIERITFTMTNTQNISKYSAIGVSNPRAISNATVAPLARAAGRFAMFAGGNKIESAARNYRVSRGIKGAAVESKGGAKSSKSGSALRGGIGKSGVMSEKDILASK